MEQEGRPPAGGLVGLDIVEQIKQNARNHDELHTIRDEYQTLLLKYRALKKRNCAIEDLILVPSPPTNLVAENVRLTKLVESNACIIEAQERQIEHYRQWADALCDERLVLLEKLKNK